MGEHRIYLYFGILIKMLFKKLLNHCPSIQITSRLLSVFKTITMLWNLAFEMLFLSKTIFEDGNR